jgi:hypothetical protein
MTVALFALWTLLVALSPAVGQKVPTAGTSANVLKDGYVFNIVEWDGGELPRLYERTDQLPLTLADLQKLLDSKFASDVIVKMLEERRCACDASADALIALKDAGATDDLIKAVSLHALPPNRSVDLTITLDFEGLGGGASPSTQSRKGYLYLIVPDGDRERVFVGNLAEILGRRWERDTLVDNTDLLLSKKVRRIVVAARVPLKTYGAKEALVFASTKPNIYSSKDIPPADRAVAQEYAFEYPVSSLQRDCSLQVLHRQDAMLPDRWHLVRTHFQCEWN